LLQNKNHCLLSNQEGVCCDKEDPECHQLAFSFSPDNPCAEDASFDYAASVFTCPTAERCPTGNTDLYLNSFGIKSGFSDSWGWFQYIAFSVCKFRVRTDRPGSNLLLDLRDISGENSVVVMVMLKNTFEYPQFTFEIGPDTA